LRRGVEKESLRVTPEGMLAQTPHPVALGSALTHRCITTDYSEALLEFITAPDGEIDAVLRELSEIHRFVYHNIGEELLWSASMPCVLRTGQDIPVAQYGSSNVARMKTIYRIGLGHRYGRAMQTIAGIHYNFSLDDAMWEWLRASTGSTLTLRDFKTEQYFALIRNFHRYSWLLVYLFGASPALCRSFVAGREHGLEELSPGTLYAPYATSLRMGDLGYQSDAQRSIDISYDGLEDYVEALTRAIGESHPAYVEIGLKDGEEWLQLSTGLLQIENEFYSTIRPKRVTRSGESPRHALRERGVEYVEVRCLDIDPFEPCGIAAPVARFIDAFLLFCLLQESPASDATERARARDNLRLVVNRGREPGLQLQRPGGEAVLLVDWGLELLEGIARIGGLLDAARDEHNTAESVAAQRAKLLDPELTPSARVLARLREQGQSFFAFAMEQSRRHRASFLSEPLAEDVQRHFRRLAEESLAEQLAIERADDISFEEHVANYFVR